MPQKTSFSVRELTQDDLDPKKGFLKTLENLTEVGDLSLKEAKNILDKIKAQGSHIFVAVTDNGQIIGATTLLLQQKFIHKGCVVGHIEDVCTRKGFECMGVGSATVKKAIEYAKKRGCYRIILDCYDKLVPFYEEFGFKKNSNEMRLKL